MEVKTVRAGRGWGWIVEGTALFRKSPVTWVAVALILYVLYALLVRIPILGIVFLLLFPAFLAGLMQGCRALELGEKLSILHLLSGFQKNPATLVTLGGILLVGNLVLYMLLVVMSGDAVATLMRQASAGKLDPATVEALAPRIMTAALVVSTLSLPLLMGQWFAPLLIYFDGLSPVRALMVSFWACWKNALPFLVYSAVFLLVVMVLTPFTIALRRIDLIVLLISPVLIPSIYASYKDVFGTGSAGARPDSSPV